MLLFNRENHPADNPQVYYRRNLAIPLLDCTISELDSRFLSLSRTASKVLQLVPTKIPDGEEHDLIDLVAMHESDLVDKYLVDQELMPWNRKWAQCSPQERPDSFGAALQRCDEERFPNIFRLLKIGCTLHFTSCTCERSFSTLRRLHNWLRSSMGCTRLSSLALMNIYILHSGLGPGHHVRKGFLILSGQIIVLYPRLD